MRFASVYAASITLPLFTMLLCCGNVNGKTHVSTGFLRFFAVFFGFSTFGKFLTAKTAAFAQWGGG